MFKTEPLQVVYKERRVCFMATGLFGKINLLPFCLSVSFEVMILPRLKSSILVVFCKSNYRWTLFRRKLCIRINFCIRTSKCMTFFMENMTEYIADAQTVCTRPLLGGGAGDEGSVYSNFSMYK